MPKERACVSVVVMGALCAPCDKATMSVRLSPMAEVFLLRKG